MRGNSVVPQHNPMSYTQAKNLSEKVALTDGPSSDAILPLHVPASSGGVSRTGYSALNSSTTMSHVGKKKYEIFPGKNTFHCGGRVIMGRDKGFFFLTVGLFLFGGALFFAFDCVYLATEVHWSLPIVGAVLYIFSLSNLLRAGLMDPGIIPRATKDEADYTERHLEAPKEENSPYRPPPRIKEVTVNGVRITLKYCFTCGIFRPPRASHCSICDNCVDNFDHHCPWVGNCVGKRNYRFFYMFLVCTCLLSLFVLACNITVLVLATKRSEDPDHTFVDTLSDWRRPASLIEGIICFITIWSVTGLAGFHTYLIANSTTTNEDIKGTWSKKRSQGNRNPFTHDSFITNFCAALCSPSSPSLLDSRGIVTEDFTVVVHKVPKPPEPYNMPRPTQTSNVEGYQNVSAVAPATNSNSNPSTPANGQS